MSSLSQKFMEHSGKDEFGNLVLLFEDKQIKMAFTDRGEPLLAYNDVARACGSMPRKSKKTTFRGDFVFVEFQHLNQVISAKYVTPPIALRSTFYRKNQDSERFRSFMMDTIGVQLPASMRARSDFPRRRDVVFKPIPGNPKYCVGDNGAIYSCRSSTWKQLKQFVNKDGYFVVAFNSDVESVGHFKFQQAMPVHRLVLLAFKGEPGERQMACHSNGIKADNRPDNLRWGTAKDNTDDMMRHQALLQQKPSRNGKLNEAMVREIRDLRSRNVPGSAIAERFKISPGLVYKVTSGKVWRDVV